MQYIDKNHTQKALGYFYCVPKSSSDMLYPHEDI